MRKPITCIGLLSGLALLPMSVVVAAEPGVNALHYPGTVAVALGQGSWDALFGMVGLVAGSRVFAELSAWLKETIEKWGDLGEVLLPDLLHLPLRTFAIGLVVLLITIILVLERLTVR